MQHPFKVAAAAFTLAATVSFNATAGVPKDLPYPSGNLTADKIMDQVYFVNHFYAFKNYAITEQKDDITVLVIKGEGKTPTTNTLERYLTNESGEGAIKAQDLAIFRSGKLRGTGMLITDFSEAGKSQEYAIWLPALRKIRRFAEPAHDDAWGGSDFTFGDVTLRKPEHETHEVTGTETFNDCLHVMDVPEAQRNKYMGNLPGQFCDAKGKQVYLLKSTTKFPSWWYDYRVSYVDTKTFADYRTEYFKDGKKIKYIDRAWGSMGLDDPRAQYWVSWYGKTLDTNHETWAVIPRDVIKWNTDKSESLWSERTLRQIKR
ncbi:MAG: outer membrane lipoprotein-sorting protein [Gammaproteobacteria bacterium]|nr:outer membrane lipoprotein-sorting protein [Gammaproteobacteria bacterium]